MKKLAIKEYDYLLNNKSIENRECFLKGFIPYIHKFATYYYDKYRHLFNGRYDYEDLVSDGILLAYDLYDSFIPNSPDYAFAKFTQIYVKGMKHLLKNTYFFNVSEGIIDKIAGLEKIKENYLEENGMLPNYKELLSLAGYQRISDKPIERIEFNDDNFGSYEIEDDVLNRVFFEELRNFFMEQLQDFSERDCTIILLYFGFLDNKGLTQEDISKIFNISKQRVSKICNIYMNSIFFNEEDHEYAKNYLKEL